MSSAIDIIRNSVTEIQVSGVPYFDFGKWHEADLHLKQKNLTALTQGTKFPLVFLLLDITEDKDVNTGFANANIELFIINKTNKNYTPTERDVLTFPEIRTISNNLITELQRKSTFDNVSYTELFYDITKKNKLESVIDVIQIGISDMKYYYKGNCIN